MSLCWLDRNFPHTPEHLQQNHIVLLFSLSYSRINFAQTNSAFSTMLPRISFLFLATHMHAMSPLSAIGASVLFRAIGVTALALIEGPADIIFVKTFVTRSGFTGFWDVIMHYEIPPLEIGFCPGSIWIFTHEMPESEVIFCNIAPQKTCHCRIDNMDILPYFTCSGGVRFRVNCSINSKCLFPLINISYFDIFIGSRCKISHPILNK